MLCSLCIHIVSAHRAWLYTILHASWKSIVEIGSPLFFRIPSKFLDVADVRIVLYMHRFDSEYFRSSDFLLIDSILTIIVMMLVDQHSI
jgi:hypothetical protein